MLDRSRLLALVCSLVLLQACGGGGDDGAGGASSTAGITDSDVALYARAVNVYAYSCRRYGYYQDCAAYNEAVSYFNNKCYRGVQKACELSQDITASYTLAGLSLGL